MKRRLGALALTVALLGLSFSALALPVGGQPARDLVGTPDQRRALLAELTQKILEREAFSPFKGEDFPALLERQAAALEDLFVRADTQTKLLRALVLLSNLRRDGHLRVRPVPGGLRYSAPADALPPVSFAVDFAQPREEILFVRDLDEPVLRRFGVDTLPRPGDRLLAVDGEPVTERLRRIEPYLACSTRHRELLELAVNVAVRRADFPPGPAPSRALAAAGGSGRPSHESEGSPARDSVTLELERPGGERYELRGPLLAADVAAWREPIDFLAAAWVREKRFAGFTPELTTRSFVLWLPEEAGRRVVLLEWREFKGRLLGDVWRLMQVATRLRLLDHDVILDVTSARGGLMAWYLLQRLVSRPFAVTRSNLRVSDVTGDLIERLSRASASGSDAADRWLRDWLAGEARRAVAERRDYTASAPFKLRALPADSDGILRPATPHFRGRLVLLTGPFARSQNDQLAAMVADNELGRIVGMPTAGTSNSWEWEEPVLLPGSERPLAIFMYSAGHTLRPNGEVLESHPPVPDDPVPMTRENFHRYHDELVRRALRWLGR